MNVTDVLVRIGPILSFGRFFVTAAVKAIF